MENPLTRFNDMFDDMLDANFHLSGSEMSYFSYPGTCVDYQVTDFSHLSCLWDSQMSYQTEPNVLLDNNIASISQGDISSISSYESPELHDDLSDFFSEHLLSSPASAQQFATPNAQISQWGSPNLSASPPATTPSACPIIFTSGFESTNHHTVMNNGQITPADSPEGLRPQLDKSTKTDEVEG